MADKTRTLLDGRGGGHPSDESDAVRRARSHTARVAALLVTLAALAATLRDDVPLVSGLAVAMLVPAALVDLREHRLPDRIVAPAGAVLAAGTALSQVLGPDLSIAGGLAGVVAFAGPLLAMHLVSPAAMGFGDVKAGVVLGFALGLVHWQLALAALALATGSTAAVGVLSRARTVALGPGLVATAAVALSIAPLFAPPDEPGALLPSPDRPTGVHR